MYKSTESFTSDIVFKNRTYQRKNVNNFLGNEKPLNTDFLGGLGNFQTQSTYWKLGDRVFVARRGCQCQI